MRNPLNRILHGFPHVTRQLPFPFLALFPLPFLFMVRSTLLCHHSRSARRATSSVQRKCAIQKYCSLMCSFRESLFAKLLSPAVSLRFRHQHSWIRSSERFSFCFQTVRFCYARTSKSENFHKFRKIENPFLNVFVEIRNEFRSIFRCRFMSFLLQTACVSSTGQSVLNSFIGVLHGLPRTTSAYHSKYLVASNVFFGVF